MSKNKDRIFTVGGFSFKSEEEAELAKKEMKGVEYIRGKTDMEYPEMVLQVYNKMVDGRLFETVVGFSYLKELQEYLRTIPYVKREDIRPIPVTHRDFEAERRKKAGGIAGSLPEKVIQGSLILNIVLVVCVIVMFLISMTGNSPNILNYENQLINRYEAWEQELSGREEAVREKEKMYGIGE